MPVNVKYHCVLALLIAVACVGGCAGQETAAISTAPITVKGNAMGAPIDLSFDMLISEQSFVVEGRRVSVVDVPQGLAANYMGSNSDPNFAEAYDSGFVQYERTFEVQVVKVHLVPKDHDPDAIPREGDTFPCSSEFYEQLPFSVPMGEQTSAAQQSAYEQHIADHARSMEQFTAQLCGGRTRLYVCEALLAPPAAQPGQQQQQQRAISALELDQSYGLEDVQRRLRQYPKGTFVKP